MLLVLLAFTAGFAMDFVWGSCVSAVTHRKPFIAAHLSVLLYLCTVVSTVLIVDNQWASITAFLVGSWAGTYCTVRWMK